MIKPLDMNNTEFVPDDGQVQGGVADKNVNEDADEVEEEEVPNEVNQSWLIFDGWQARISI